MYITYHVRQISEKVFYEDNYPKVEFTGRHERPPRRFYYPLSKSGFTPTWLVRVSDMTVVPGSSATEGYCALSYSWGQSGDMTVANEKTGKMTRVDEGKHRIIFPAKTVRKSIRGRKRIKRKVKFVKFEGIIQQVCKDFNIKYVWFDQMCIPQNDHKAKHHEIHLMHHIYSNAYCTVVLVPEYCTEVVSLPGIRRCRIPRFGKRGGPPPEWMQRLWTFEEALLSRRLLFVGQDAHSWGDLLSLDIFSPTYDLCSRPLRSNSDWWNVCNILFQAHNRTTTKVHDRVFALGIMFPDIMKEFTIDYKQPYYDLLVRFYGLLAKKDLTILCFGQRISGKSQMMELNLPSWTGAAGEHKQHHTIDPDKNVVVDIVGNIMHVTCSSVINKIPTPNPSTWTYDDIPPSTPPPELGIPVRRTLATYVQLPEHKDKKTVLLTDLAVYNEKERTLVITPGLQVLARLLPLKNKDIFWWYGNPNGLKDVATFSFDLTEDGNNQGSIPTGNEGEYALLSGIRFDYYYSGRFPVIRKEGEHYKAIGTCIVKNPDYFFSDYNPPSKTFTIQ